MLIVFFDSKGVVHREFVPAGQTVNGQFYVEVLERLRLKVRRVRREIVDTWILHHDNAPSHTSLRVREFLAKHNVATLPQPPYSPDLASPFLFPRMERTLKRHHYGMVERVQAASMQCLKEIPVVDFQRAYQAWQKRWQRCINAEGSYFEEF
ncbi:histone-lysine n-methyltransferase setmar-like protein [Lasius niger]|uniref:Histone-lysine n-methyltransferase setmar-like protein n=1 Tax=Lasius niger TaxID=67767 RepID=A0A0J7KP85_LASNI|nr:histone-lysine n-methyltransferase setmar-like protein [Lasius niger]